MPIYEYRCGRCGHEFERLQKISEPDPERCPECGASEVARLISPVGFRLKGGGWYETDFKNSNRRNVVAGDKAGGEKTAETKKDGKADSTVESAKKEPEAKKKGGDREAAA